MGDTLALLFSHILNRDLEKNMTRFSLVPLTLIAAAMPAAALAQSATTAAQPIPRAADSAPDAGPRVAVRLADF